MTKPTLTDLENARDTVSELFDQWIIYRDRLSPDDPFKAQARGVTRRLDTALFKLDEALDIFGDGE